MQPKIISKSKSNLFITGLTGDDTKTSEVCGDFVVRFRIFESGDWIINLTLAKPCNLDDTFMALSY